jgi:O-antigen/teichoic acid export membrane protein
MAFIASYFVPTVLVWGGALRHADAKVAVSFMRRVREVVTAAWPLAIANTSARLGPSALVLLLGALAGSGAAGLFRAAQLPWAFVAWSAVVVASVVYSSIARVAATDRFRAAAVVRALAELQAWAYGFVGVTMGLLSQWLMPRLYGPAYQGAVSLLVLLSVALPLTCVVFFVREIVGVIQEQLTGLLMSVIGVAVVILLGIPLAMIGGAVGVAVATVLAELSTIIVAALYARNRLQGGPISAIAVLIPSLTVGGTLWIVELSMTYGVMDRGPAIILAHLWYIAVAALWYGRSGRARLASLRLHARSQPTRMIDVPNNATV